MKKALVVGIDKYQNASPLYGCVNDAESIAGCLAKNGDGSPNFSVKLITSDKPDTVTTANLHAAIAELFSGDADIALLFFAGHGVINPETNSGFILSHDGKKPAWGISLADVNLLAKRAHPRIKSTVVILDSCNSGFMGEVPSLEDNFSAIGTGLTVLTACHREGTAAENGGQGLFTMLLLDGLSGASADIRGHITPASVYSHIDQALGVWEQRPIYKANVQTFVSLRQVEPKVPLVVLRSLPKWFPDPATIFKLDPSFEPDRKNVPVEFRDLPVNEENQRVFKALQQCNRHGLVVPVDAEHMYDAAIGSTGCRLTALGAHYRMLATLDRI